ncbi:PhaM family polyhydroxyalkanoate granule multifunctional regulatory protein [Azonexus sp.]|uniref:PhaM family polyhydroxyalkanoate granule multifunctional regulatory protein n=1 Tax=Azonexus sp. TaxID=1872668 RepID=UPI0039E4D859
MLYNQGNDPLNFMRNLWGNMGFSLPGMVTPTFDVDELDKRIKDMKAVEGWLRMNLSMLQMTIQGLEMQRTTVGTVQAMGQMASQAAQQMQPAAPAAASATPAAESADPTDPAAPGFLTEAMLFPWQMMQQMRTHLEQMQEQIQTEAPAADTPPAATKAAAKKRPAARSPAAKKKAV